MIIRIAGNANWVKAFILAVSVIAFGCGANESVLRSGKDNTAGRANATPVRTSFETDLEAMRTAGFSFIYVLRRKDGGVIDPEDKSVIRVQTTQANRRVSADDGKAVIVGSNFQLAPHNMAAIYQRFAVDNYSPAPSSGTAPLPPDNQNVNR
ncbi:MAG: hypothetical protein ABL999_01655 [Pyrinomonadaceae bacterium]